MKLYPIAALGAAALALAACSVDLQTGGTYWGAPGGGSQISSGGAAGRLGPTYCNTVPQDINERNRWNDLCFGTR